MKNTRRNSAFSLIEISIVVLIIGILVAGVTQSSRLLNVARLNSARNLTQSAPVSSIKNLALWIDSTSETSFQANASSPTELDENTPISNWNDLNPQTTLKANLTGSGDTRPLYERNSMNNLPSVFFDGIDDFMSTSNFQNISTQSTVFAVVRLPAALANQAILSKRPSDGVTHPNIELSTTTTSGWRYLDGSGSTGYTPITTAVPTAASTSYVLSAVYTANSVSGGGTTTATGHAFFQNGGTAAYTGVGATTYGATTGASPNTSVSDALFIGKQGLATSPSFFGGRIGEIIIFDRALKKEERQSIESYLGKKWGITMTVASY
jgi:prepilin-type N-terminal cleavage/methylation domain-containing protein